MKLQYRGIQHDNVKSAPMLEKHCVYRGTTYVRSFEPANKVIGLKLSTMQYDNAIAA